MPTCPSIPVCCDDPYSYQLPGTPYPPLPTGAPVVTSATVDVISATHLSYQILATNNPTSYGASGLPAGLILNAATGIISGTITDPDPLTYIVEISATNPNGTGFGTLTINVLPLAPVVTSQSLPLGVGVALAYQIIATHSPTSYGATSLPTGLVIDTVTGIISGTIVSTSSATYTIGLTATNAGGTGSGTLTLHMVPAFTITLSNGGVAGASNMISIDGGAYAPYADGTYTLHPSSQIKIKEVVGPGSYGNTGFTSMPAANGLTVSFNYPVTTAYNVVGVCAGVGHFIAFGRLDMAGTDYNSGPVVGTLNLNATGGGTLQTGGEWLSEWSGNFNNALTVTNLYFESIINF